MPNVFTDLQVTTTNANVTSSIASGVDTIGPTGDPASVAASNINTVLTTGTNVALITVGSPNNSEPGNIEVDSTIGWASTKTLSLDAAGSIAINAGIFGGAGSTLILASGGTIDQSASIGAATLSGSSSGATTLSNAINAVSTLGDFGTGSSNFTFNNLSALTIDGIVIAGVFDLSSLDGLHELSTSQIMASQLQSANGVSFHNATFAGTFNAIAALGNFAVASGDFTLVDNVPVLTIDGAVSANDITITNLQPHGEIVQEAAQYLVVGGSPSGHFTLTFKGQTTGSIATTASAAAVQAALDGLSTIGGVGGGDGHGGRRDLHDHVRRHADAGRRAADHQHRERGRGDRDGGRGPDQRARRDPRGGQHGARRHDHGD